MGMEVLETLWEELVKVDSGEPNNKVRILLK